MPQKVAKTASLWLEPILFCGVAAALVLVCVPRVHAEDQSPPETPRVSGIENDGSYIGTVRPVFSTHPGVRIRAKMSRNGEEARDFKSGTPVYQPGDYVLTVVATKESNDRTRTALVNFTVRRASLAILTFRAAEGVPVSIATAAGEILKSNLVRTQLFDLVERERIDAILKEQALQKSGCTDTECAIQIGQLLAAHKILFGTIARTAGGYLISASISDVEKGKLDFAETVTIKDDAEIEKGLLAITKKISAKILGIDESLFSTGPPPRAPYLWRSMLLPGWGQWHEGSEQKGRSIMAGTAGLAVFYAVLTLQFNKAQAEYRDAAGVPAVPGQPTVLLNYFLIHEKREALATAEARLNTGAIAFGLFWLWNIFDVYFFPADAEGTGGSPGKTSLLLYLGPDVVAVSAGAIPAHHGASVRLGLTLRF